MYYEMVTIFLEIINLKRKSFPHSLESMTNFPYWRREKIEN